MWENAHHLQLYYLFLSVNGQRLNVHNNKICLYYTFVNSLEKKNPLFYKFREYTNVILWHIDMKVIQKWINKQFYINVAYIYI